MYFTVAELRLLWLTRQSERIQAAYLQAKKRGWRKQARTLGAEVQRMNRHVDNTRASVQRQIAEYAEKKAKWLERLS